MYVGVVTSQDIKDDTSKHKFRFDGIVLNESDLLIQDKKTIFDNYIKKQITVKGNTLKRGVRFDMKKKNDNNVDKPITTTNPANNPNIK